MTLGDGQALHCWELVAACCVGDLQRAHTFVTADHLPVRILHCGDVRVPERALHETKDQGALANTSSPEHHHTVVIALLWHAGMVHSGRSLC